MRVSSLLMLALAAGTAFAQQPVGPNSQVIVTGSYEPIPLSESDRAVQLFDLRGTAPLVNNTVVDVLRLDPSVDVRARGPNNIQSDISIRGATFGQTLVLLNGLRLNDVQSGHNNMDLPVPLEAIQQVEVLKGSGSTLYGSDAIGGVVNFVTGVPESTELRLRGAVGNFGVNQERGVLSVVEGVFAEQLSFSRDFSTGFRPDRDYRNLQLSSTTHYRHKSLGNSSLTLGYGDHPFGADQFYGAYPSWERTKTWFAGFRQELGEQTEIDFGYRRHTDLFVLFRDQPGIYTNRHIDDSWQAAVRRAQRVAVNTKLNYGIEGFHDSINSSNLGLHNRSRGAAYVSLDVRALQRFSFSVGAREEVYTGLAHQFTPSAAAGYWLSSKWKLRASASRAFRLPSYTDLYYSDPANLGSPNLRPEQAWSYDGGVEFRPSERWRADVTVFTRRERDGIDYVRASPTAIWQATNFDRLNFTGVESALELNVSRSQFVALRYTLLHSSSDASAAQYSKYSFDYPNHNAVAEYRASVRGAVQLRTRVGVLQRYGQDPYAVWDLYAAGTRGAWHPFVQFTNLTNTDYQEILGVQAVTRAALVGVEWQWHR